MAKQISSINLPLPLSLRGFPTCSLVDPLLDVSCLPIRYISFKESCRLLAKESSKLFFAMKTLRSEDAVSEIQTL